MVEGIPLLQVLGEVGEEHILLVQGEVEVEGGYIGRGQELCVEEEDELLVVGVVVALAGGQGGGEDTLEEVVEEHGQAAAGLAGADAP